MITRIGIVAGDIWHLLEQKGEVTLSLMTSEIAKSRDVILMGLGWLAREGHVILKEKAGDFRASLRKKSNKAQTYGTK